MLDYLPALVIVAGLGVMAYFMTKAGREADQKRKAAADSNGWQYDSYRSAIVYNVPDEERNISYRLSGVTSQRANWNVTCRHLKTIEKGSDLKVELQPSTEFEAQLVCEHPFLIMPHDGITLPDFVLAQIFKKLNFPDDTPRVEGEQLPAQFSATYALYTAAPGAAGIASQAVPLLTNWSSKYKGKRNALIIKGGPDGFKIRTERGMEKAEEMVYFTETALSLSQLC